MTDENFLQMAQAAFEDPENTDFVALRVAYIDSEMYQPTGHYTYQKLIGRTNSATEFDDVVRICEKLLDNNPMDLEVRMMLDYAYEQIDQYDLAAKHRTFIEGMLRAIFESGDGRSMESAWQVIAVAEEYTLLSVMGLKLESQSLLNEGDYFYDMLTVTKRVDDGSAESVDLYFDITDPFLYLQNML